MVRWGTAVSSGVSAIAALVTAALIALQSLVMNKQRVAMDQQVRYMRKGWLETRRAAAAAELSAKTGERRLKLTQRADVLVDSIFFVDKITGQLAGMQRNSNVLLVLKNFGNTRAEYLQLKVWLDIPNVPRSDQILGPTTLGAGDTQTIAFVNFGACITQKTADSIRTGKIVMRVRGAISYKDVFGETHDLEVGPMRYNARHHVFRDEENPDSEKWIVE